VKFSSAANRGVAGTSKIIAQAMAKASYQPSVGKLDGVSSPATPRGTKRPNPELPGHGQLARRLITTALPPINARIKPTAHAIRITLSTEWIFDWTPANRECHQCAQLQGRGEVVGAGADFKHGAALFHAKE
jgi:hypothetical protein